MTEKYLSSLWSAIAPGLGNHLWQSTLVAAAAGLLTLLLRNHHARVRYWLWMAGSLKFFIPFSWLVSVGQRVAWSRPAEGATPFLLNSTVVEIAQPFVAQAAAAPHAGAMTPTFSFWSHLPAAVLVLWLCGFVVVALVWALRWRQIAATMKSAELLSEGREVGALRRLERIGGIRRPIALLLSRNSLEPGVFGIHRPALIWPAGISSRLEDSHLEAILAHEVWHVRRRDNLCALFHMLVEAVFWFYPPVWWLGSRLLAERERACDEEVVALGGQRQTYAESILKVCEFCLGSPLACVSGVTGADLKQRMVRIMSDRILHKLNFARKLLLTSAAFLAIAIPITFGVFHATPGRAQAQTAAAASARVYSSVSIKHSDANPTSDNSIILRSPQGASIKPDNADATPTKRMFFTDDGGKNGDFTARGVTLQALIEMAYHLQGTQISGGLDLLNKTRFDIDAKLDPSFVAAMHQQSAQQNLDDQALLKSILANEFKLAAHFETRTMPAYDLVIDENGSKLQPSDGALRMMRLGPGELSSSGSPLALLTEQLAERVGRPVIDKTGLKGNYAFNLHWGPDFVEDHPKQPGQLADPEPDSSGAALMNALREQLGLKLEPQNEPVQNLVIDHAEEPAQN